MVLSKSEAGHEAKKRAKEAKRKRGPARKQKVKKVMKPKPKGKVMDAEEAKAAARKMIKKGASVEEIVTETGLHVNTINGLRTYLVKEERIRRLLHEGKSIGEIREDAGLPSAMIRSIARAEHVKPPEKPKTPKVKEDESILSVKLDDKERELLEKGKSTMLAFQDAGIIPKKLRDDSNAEFIRLASLSLANAVVAMQGQIREGK